MDRDQYTDYVDSMPLKTRKRITDAENPAGSSRPILEKTPVPWIGGLGPKHEQWANIDVVRVEEATDDKLCIICGEVLGDDYVYANYDGKPHDTQDRRIIPPKDGQEAILMLLGIVPAVEGAPTPTFTHARCCLIASSFCPHLKKQEHPALTKNGEPLTKDELRKLATVHKD